jgi:hypothetical protein
MKKVLLIFSFFLGHFLYGSTWEENLAFVLETTFGDSCLLWNTTDKHLYGAQIGLFYSVSDPKAKCFWRRVSTQSEDHPILYGLQASAIYCAAEGINGLQICGALNKGKMLKGLQIALCANQSEKLYGTQVSFYSTI